MHNGAPCPVCLHNDLRLTVERSCLPAMQNYTFSSLASARAARSGRLQLKTCAHCGFTHNVTFEAALMDYDEGYDNTVPSAIMDAYYKDLAHYLTDKYLRGGGLVVDIGCGKGAFLKTLCAMSPDVRGLGIDPSWPASAPQTEGRISFVADFFSPSYITKRPTLVVCRHVLEHIDQPLEFLKGIRSALAAFADVPFFLEVPDLDWIIEHDAFWDFYHEHCNYFTVASVTSALQRAGFTPVRATPSYGDQYIWIEAVAASRISAVPQWDVDVAADLVQRFGAYVERESNMMGSARRTLRDLKRDGWAIAIWGMAAKGVVFACLMDPDASLIDVCVDVNMKKHGHFVPLTGHRIEPPAALSRLESLKAAVIVMNPNYLDEIRTCCRDMSLAPRFLNASGADLKGTWRIDDALEMDVWK